MEVEDHDASAAAAAAAAAVVTKQNQAAEADSVDALWEENMSHFHRTKKGRECDMSLAELGELLGLDQADQAAVAAADTAGAQAVSATGGGGGEELAGQQAAANEAYWTEAVEYHRRTMRRDDALREIERVASWERRWKHHQRQRQRQDDQEREEGEEATKEREEAEDDGEDGDDEQEAACKVERYGRTMTPQVWRQLDALRPQQP